MLPSAILGQNLTNNRNRFHINKYKMLSDSLITYKHALLRWIIQQLLEKNMTQYTLQLKQRIHLSIIQLPPQG
jgi:hypothetical protein